jgi:hypothetical protein
MLMLPLENEIDEQVANMKALIDQQQSQIDIELRFQDVLTDGLIYGLGVGKSYWRREPGVKTVVIRERSIPLPGLSKYVVDQVPSPRFDDACFEAVDPFDFFRDPMGTDIDSCEYLIHRTWRSHDYVLDKIMEGSWTGAHPDDVEEQSGRSSTSRPTLSGGAQPAWPRTPPGRTFTRCGRSITRCAEDLHDPGPPGPGP